MEKSELIHQSVCVGDSVVHVLHDVHRALGGTCGSVLWTSSTALADWLSDRCHRKLIVGSSIIELGSGLGFLGSVLHRMGAAHVLMTDVPRQLPVLRQNIACNVEQECAAVQCCSFLWGERPPKVFSRRWDLVVACDVVYNIDHIPTLADSLGALMELGGTRALLALPDREDFGYHLRDAQGKLHRQFDYELLLRDLQKRMLGTLNVEVLDTIATPDLDACGNNVVLLLLSRSVGEAPVVK